MASHCLTQLEARGKQTLVKWSIQVSLLGDRAGREGWGVDLEGQIEETHHPGPTLLTCAPAVRQTRYMSAGNIIPAFYLQEAGFKMREISRIEETCSSNVEWIQTRQLSSLNSINWSYILKMTEASSSYCCGTRLNLRKAENNQYTSYIGLSLLI